MGKHITACISFLLITGLAFGQQHLVDSIQNQLKGPMADSNRAMSMMRLAIDYEVVDTAKAYEAYRNAIRFGLVKKLYYQVGRTYQNQAALYKTAAQYQRALESLDTAITFYKKSNHPRVKLWESNAYNDKANCLKLLNENQQAVEYYLKSIALLEEANITSGLVSKYTNLSIHFGDMREPQKQLEYAEKGLRVAKSLGVRQDLFMAYYILANTYSTQNNDLAAKKAVDSATLYFDEAENADNVDMVIAYYLVSAQVRKKMGLADSAFYFFNKAYSVSNAYNYGYGKAESQLQMGAIATVQKKYAEAEQYLLAGIDEAKAINYYVMLDEGYKYLADVYAATNRYKEAYHYLQQYKEVNDSVLSMESRKYAKELEGKYASAKKDKQIAMQKTQLQQRRLMNYMLASAAFALLIFFFLFRRNYLQKQELQQQRISELETEKQLAATEAVLKGEAQERSRLAKDLHDGLGGMLSGIKYSLHNMKGNLIMTPENAQAFERSIDMLDSSISEMRRVAHNMMPEALLKFGLDEALKDFCNDLNKSGVLSVNYQSIGMEDAEISSTQAITIYRIVQELLNNTTKHAGAKVAIVQLSKVGNALSVTVEDNGQGFDISLLQQRKGMGWSNIYNRVELLKGTVDIKSSAEKGTSVYIEIPV